MSFKVLPYRAGSRSARSLADTLGGRCLRTEGSTYRRRPGVTIINWGSTSVPTYLQPVLNGNTVNLLRASNKLSFFQHHTGAEYLPPFWTRREDIPNDAFPIVCRTVLAGHSGAGIVIADTRAELVHAQLYVKYIKKQSEYRIHVGRRTVNHVPTFVVIAEQKKSKRADVPAEEANFRVRNHQNGFIYQREGIEVPASVRTQAITALQHSNLDFGAVDVIYNAASRRAWVLEINTAPGLEGQTIVDYRNFFQSLNG